MRSATPQSKLHSQNSISILQLKTSFATHKIFYTLLMTSRTRKSINCRLSFFRLSFFRLSFFRLSFFRLSFFRLSFCRLSFFRLSFFHLSFFRLSFFRLSFFSLSFCLDLPFHQTLLPPYMPSPTYIQTTPLQRRERESVEDCGGSRGRRCGQNISRIQCFWMIGAKDLFKNLHAPVSLHTCESTDEAVCVGVWVGWSASVSVSVSVSVRCLCLFVRVVQCVSVSACLCMFARPHTHTRTHAHKRTNTATQTQPHR